MLVIESLPLGEAKQFYIHNLESLFKGSGRPIWLSLFVLFIEHFILFSLMLTKNFLDEYQNQDTSLQNLQYVSLHEIPYSDCQWIVMVIFAFNIAILVAFLVLFVYFCFRKFEQQKIIILSTILMNYNSVITLPSILLSMKSPNGIGISNITLTIILSIFVQLHSTHFYFFNVTDWLAKRGNTWDYIRFLFLIIIIIGLESFDSGIYPELILAYLIINILAVMKDNMFYKKIITIFYLTLNLILLSITVERLTLQTTTTHTFGVYVMCMSVLAYKVAEITVEQLEMYRIRRFQEFQFESRTQQLDKKRTEHKSQDIEYLIDFYARYLNEKTSVIRNNSTIFKDLFNKMSLLPVDMGNGEKEKTGKDNKVNQKPQINQILSNSLKDATSFESLNERQQQLKQQPQISALKSQDPFSSSTNTHLGLFIEIEDIFAEKSLNEQLKAIHEVFQTQIMQNDHMRGGHHQQSSSDYYIRYLMYLLEIEKNYPLATIKLFEYLHFHKQLSLSNLSIFQQIQHELSKIKHEEHSSRLDLAFAFKFEDDLACLNEMLFNCIQLKGKFIGDLSKDCLDLLEISKIGGQFLKLRRNIAIKLIKLRNYGINSNDLNTMQEIFLDVLWMDPTDKYFTLLKLNGNAKFSRKMMRIQFQKSTEKAAQMQKSLLESATVMISLEQSKFGDVIKTSNNIQEIISFSRKEIIGKNCSVLMPFSIGQHHDGLIKQGIENKLKKELKKNAPLFVMKKNGFSMRISLEYQVHNMLSLDIGIIGKMQSLERESERYILGDISKGGCKLEAISRSIFEELFQKYFQSPKDLSGIQLHQILPCLTQISQTAKDLQLTCFAVKSLLFLPPPGIRPDRIKRRLQDKSQNFSRNADKKYYGMQSNDIYQVDLKLQIFSKEDTYEVILVKVKEFQMILSYQQYEEILRNQFIPHLKEFNILQDKEEITSQIFNQLMKQEDLFALSTVRGSKSKQSTSQSFNMIDNNNFFCSNNQTNYMTTNNNNETSIIGGKQTRFDDKGINETMIQIAQQHGETSMLIQNQTAREDSVTAPMRSGTLTYLSQQEDPRGYFHNFKQQNSYEGILYAYSKENHLQQQQQSKQPKQQQQTQQYFQQDQSPSYSMAMPANKLNLANLSLISKPKENKISIEEGEIEKRIVKEDGNLSSYQSDSYPNNDGNSEKKTGQLGVQDNDMDKPGKDLLSFETGALIPNTGILSQEGLMSTKEHIAFSPLGLSKQSSVLFGSKNNLNKRPDDNMKKKLHGHSNHKAKYFKANSAQNESEDNNNNTHPTQLQNKTKSKHKNSNYQGSVESTNTTRQQSMRQAVGRKIIEQKRSVVLAILLGYIFCSFFGMIIIVGTSYIILNRKLSKQELSSKFSWWQDVLSNDIVNVIRLNSVHSMIQQGTFAFSSDPNTISFDNSIAGSIQTSFESFLDEFKILSQHDPQDVDIAGFIYSISINYTTFSTTTMVPKNRTASLFTAFISSSYSSYQLSTSYFQPKQLTELEVMSNFGSIGDSLTQLGTLQTESQNYLKNDIQSSVKQSLIIIASLSSFIAFILLPFYTIFQIRKEFILRLFATLEPSSVRLMSKQLLSVVSFWTNQQYKEGQEQIFDGLNINTKDPKLKNKQQILDDDNNNNNNNNMKNVKRDAIREIAQIILKKKKNVPTTSIPKFNIKLLIQIIIIAIIINVQPIVNVILTSIQIDQLSTSKDIIKGLYSLETILNEMEFALASHSLLFFNPYAKFIPISSYYGIILLATGMAKTYMQSFVGLLSNLLQNSRYTDNTLGTFIYEVFSSNLCLAFKNYQDYAPSDFDYTECVEIYDGLFTKGYLQVVQTYVNFYSDYLEIATQTDTTLQIQQFTVFFQKNDPLVQEKILHLLSSTTEAVVTVVTNDKNSYFSTISLTQILLFFSEILLLVIIFPTLIFPFFAFIRNQLVFSIELLSILQLPDISSNSYILNFLKTK